MRGFLRPLGVSVWLIALYLAVGSGVAFVAAKSLRWIGRVPKEFFILAAILALSFGFATWVVAVRVAGWSWGRLGWQPRGGAVRRAALGAALGSAAAVLAVVLTLAFAGASIRVAPTWGDDVVMLLPLAVGLLAAALFEELVFRGFPLGQLATAIGKWPAILGLSLSFGLAHLRNDHAALLGVLNIVLAGIWLSLAFFSSGGMPRAWGVHFGWNLGLALLDAPVSGFSLGLPAIVYRPGQHPWVDGGAFGPEGGIVGTIAMCAGIAAVARQDAA